MFSKVLMTSAHNYANCHPAKYGSNERVETRLITFAGHVRYMPSWILNQLSTFTGIKVSFTYKFILDIPAGEGKVPLHRHRIC